jgi:DNA topoisomerase VI subunit A
VPKLLLGLGQQKSHEALEVMKYSFMFMTILKETNYMKSSVNSDSRSMLRTERGGFVCYKAVMVVRTSSVYKRLTVEQADLTGVCAFGSCRRC